MDGFTLFLFFIGSIGISLGIFISIILLYHRESKSNIILGLLLLFLCIRIGKSVFYNFVDLPVFIKNIGLAANLAVGPLLFLYGRSILNKNFLLRKIDILHFIPAVLYLMFSPIIPNDTESVWWLVTYSFVLAQSFIYVILSAYQWLIHFEKGISSKWYIILTLGLAIMWLIYLFIFIKLIPMYLAGAYSFTFLMGYLSFLAIKERIISYSFFNNKYVGSSLSQEKSKILLNKVKRLLDAEQLYLELNLNLDYLANKTGINSKTLSQVINENTGLNFANFINEYRVEYAKQLLENSKNRDKKIIAIAMESGFNSLSTFNSVFKRKTTMTPSEFKKSIPKS